MQNPQPTQPRIQFIGRKGRDLESVQAAPALELGEEW
jgi:hypothetical protein